MNKSVLESDNKKKKIDKGITSQRQRQLNIPKTSLPIMAMIEVSRFCNLRCPSCPIGKNKIKNRAMMSFGDFKKIIKLVNNSVREISLFNYGEPLTNSDIAKMIRFAKNNGINNIKLHSNGLLLNKKLSRELIKSGLDEISISIDGASNKTYKKYRIGGDLNILLKNTKDFIELKKNMNIKKPVVVAQFIIMKHNQGEIEKFSEICKNIGVDKIIYKTFNAYMSGYEDRKINLKFVPTNIKYSRYKTAKAKGISDYYKLNHCMWPWENLVVNANGDIALCCHDYNADYQLGNILRDDNWWNTENRKKIQNSIIRRNNKINMCKHCAIGIPYLNPGNIKRL